MLRARAGTGCLLLMACLSLPLAQAQPPARGPVLDWAGANARLMQVSDGVSAAQAGVARADGLDAASRWLRVPEVTAEVRRMHLEKTVELPGELLGPLQPILGNRQTFGAVVDDWLRGRWCLR